MAHQQGFRFNFFLAAALIIPLACTYPAPYVADPEAQRADDSGIDIVVAPDLLRVHDTVQARCYILHRDGTRRPADSGTAWSTSDPLVLEAGPSGLIRALGPGSAEIIAEAGGFSASRRVTVEGIPDYSGLVISEVCYDPLEQEESLEFIELVNTSPEVRGIGGMILIDGSSKSTPFIFPGGTMLEPGAFMVVARSSGVFTEKFGVTPDFGTLALSLNNTGESVFLISPDGERLDQVFMEGGTAEFPAPAEWCATKQPAAPDGQSVYRISPDDTDSCADWSAGTPTPGY